MRNVEQFNKKQLTLGQLIEKLKAAQKIIEHKDTKVQYDFGHFFPTDFFSWRGAYEEGCLSIKSYDDAKGGLIVQSFIDILEGMVGGTMYGYKGGEYRITKDTPVWAAEWGMSGQTAVVDVFANSYQCFLITAYCEY